MARSTKFYGDWAEHDGKVVKIDGLNYRLQCHVFKQRYPYEDEVIRVYAEPMNKRSKHYQETKRELGDDWSTDVLDSDVTLQADILHQLNQQAAVKS